MVSFTGERVVVHPGFAFGLDSGDFVGNSVYALFVAVEGEFYRERAALVGGEPGDPAKSALDRPVAGKACARLKPRYIPVFKGDRIFPEREAGQLLDGKAHRDGFVAFGVAK
jgi:hypothetical protein